MLKAKIAHQAGFYLWGGRWHKVKQDKPVPAGAPVAAHPHAAGQHAPAKHFTEDQWDQLKLPDDHKDAKVFNSRLEKLREWAEDGNVTAILGASYTDNATGKRLAKIANQILSSYGSTHTVKAGQKPGQHDAVQTEPAAQEPTEPAETKAETPEPEKKPARITAVVVRKPKTDGLPEFEEGKNTTGVKAYYEEIAKKIQSMAANNDLAGIEALKEKGLQPNAKGKVGHSWQGKTGNSKALLAYYDKVVGELNAKQPTSEPVKPQIIGQLIKEKMAQAEAAKQATAAKLPTIPKFDDFNHEVVAKQWSNMLSDGKSEDMKNSVMTLLGNLNSGKVPKNDDTAKLLSFGLLSLKAVGHLPQGISDAINEMLAPKATTQSTVDEDPKEGDTKQGVDGMLVFKNGRWHKQEPKKAEPSAPPSSLDAIAMPDFAALSPGKHGDAYNLVAASLLKQAKEYGPVGLKGLITKHKDGTFTIKAAGWQLKKIGANEAFGNEAQKARRAAMHKFVTELLTAVGKAPKTKKPKAASPAAQSAAVSPISMSAGTEAIDGWTQTGPQGGSNPGGKFKDPSGTEWYCKFPADEDVAKSEVLAAKLYALAGVKGQDAKLITKDGKVGIASRWVDVKKAAPAELTGANGVKQGFAIDAWLGNWDVVGAGYDNLQLDQDGNAVRVDAGGSLTYRAQGGKKAFGDTVSELDTLRDSSINPQAAAVFGNMSKEAITASAAKLAAIPDAAIQNLVAKFGYGSDETKGKLADTLIARKNDILAKFPKAAKAAKEKPAPVFNPAFIMTPPDFTNWNDTGKGLSTHSEINDFNNSAVQAVYKAALKGDLDTIKNATAPIFNKNTKQYEKDVPLSQHPSVHVRTYWENLVNEVDLQLNPPRPADIGLIVESDDLDIVSATLNPVKSGGSVAAVKKHQKIGKYILLGIAKAISLITPKKNDMIISSDVWRSAAREHYKKSSSEAKSTFNLYLGSSGANALNTALREGNVSKHVNGKTVEQHVSDFKELLVDIPEGSTFVRRMGNKGYGQTPSAMATKEMQQFLMTCEKGTTIQEPGFSSTSWTGGNSVLGNNDIEWHFTASKGVKMFPAWLSANSGEGEGLLPPNQRYSVVSSKKVGNTVHVEAILLPYSE